MNCFGADNTDSLLIEISSLSASMFTPVCSSFELDELSSILTSSPAAAELMHNNATNKNENIIKLLLNFIFSPQFH